MTGVHLVEGGVRCSIQTLWIAFHATESESRERSCIISSFTQPFLMEMLVEKQSITPMANVEIKFSACIIIPIKKRSPLTTK